MEKSIFNFSEKRLEEYILMLYRLYLWKRSNYHMAAIIATTTDTEDTRRHDYQTMAVSRHRFEIACEVAAEAAAVSADVYAGYVIDKVEKIGGDVVEGAAYWLRKYEEHRKKEKK